MNAEIYLESMAFALPASRSVDDLVAEAGCGEGVLERLRLGGLSAVPTSEGTLPVLVAEAVDAVARDVRGARSRTAMALVMHSIPLVAPSGVCFTDLCLRQSEFRDAQALSVGGQPCAVLHFGVQLACELVRGLADEDAGVLLVGADKAYRTCDRLFFGSAMGDSAFAAFVSTRGPRNRILASISECDAIASQGELSPPDRIQSFRDVNPLLIRHAIRSCLDRAGLELDDVNRIVPHTPYTQVWDVMAELLGYPRDQILTDYIAETGHLNSNDSFCHYARACREGKLAPGDVALLVNPGFGGTRGCTLIQR